MHIRRNAQKTDDITMNMNERGPATTKQYDCIRDINHENRARQRRFVYFECVERMTYNPALLIHRHERHFSQTIIQ